MIKIDQQESIYNLVTKYPDIKEIMSELGFTDIIKPGLLQSVGRIMNLKKGRAMKNIDMDTLTKAFKKHGYEII